MSACFYDPLWLRQPTFCPHPCDFRFDEGVKTKRGKERRNREEGDGRLQKHGERTKCSFVVALHTGNFINCAFCYADACRPSQPPSPLSPSSFLFPLSSFLFPFSSFLFLLSPFFFPLLSLIGGEAFLSATRVSRIIKGLLSLSVSLSQICRLQFSQSSFSFPFRCAQNFQVSSGRPFVTTSPVQTRN